jgi:hypothetical protein
LNNSQVSEGQNSKIRRGLVLEGGGAKGAWQFGALQALDEAGIKFDYVAGTSVGALNGALWAAGRLDLGEKLWGSLGRSKVFKVRLHHSPLFLVGLFARIFYAYVKGYILPDAASLHARIILYSLMGLPTIVVMIQITIVFFPILFSGNPFSGSIPWLLLFFTQVMFIGSAIGFTLGSITGKNVSNRRRFFYLASLALWVFLLPSLFSDTLHDALGRMPILLLFLGEIPFAVFCIAVLLRTLNTSIFSVAPLEIIINDLLAGGFKVPLFATAAREIHEYFDPDNLRYRSTSNDYHGKPLPLSAIVPRYLRVDILNPGDAINILLATSALPLGIAPRRKGINVVDAQEWISVYHAMKEGRQITIDTLIKEGQGEKALIEEALIFGRVSDGIGKGNQEVVLMDGGVVDNIPWYKFIEDVPCDEIVIVGCNPMSKWIDFEMKQEWKIKNRLLNVIQAGFESNEMPRRFGRAIKNDPPQVIPFREPKHWPKRVVLVAPETPLGTFLTGTLNFSADVARKRLVSGYHKAFRIIEEFNLSH